MTNEEVVMIQVCQRQEEINCFLINCIKAITYLRFHWSGLSLNAALKEENTQTVQENNEFYQCPSFPFLMCHFAVLLGTLF